MQTSQVLINNMFNHKHIDRVGLFEGFWNETLDKWVNDGYPTRTVVINGEETTKPEDPCLFFDFDLQKTGGYFDTEPKLGFEELIDETDEWKVVKNGAGATLKWWKHKSGTPEHIDFSVNNRNIWDEEYRPHLLSLNLDRFNCKWWRGDNTLKDDLDDLTFARERQKWSFYGHVFVVEIMRNMLGDFNLYQSFLLDPGWIHDICQVYTQFFKQHFTYLIDNNGLPDGIWFFEDIAYKNGLFASPKTYSELILPYYQEIVSFFNDLGLPVIFHTDGNIDQGIPLIIDSGFVGLNPIEVKAGCDILEYAEKYGDDLVFIGGLDVRILETNDRDIIRKEIVQLLEGMKKRNARFIFGSDHTVTPNVDFDTYRYALDVYHQHKMF